MLRGNLQSTFIEPLTREVERSGVRILSGHAAVEISLAGGEVGSVTARRADGLEEVHRADAYLLATPLEVCEQRDRKGHRRGAKQEMDELRSLKVGAVIGARERQERCH